MIDIPKAQEEQSVLHHANMGGMIFDTRGSMFLKHRLSSVRMTTHQRTDRAWYLFGAGSENTQTRCTARTQKTLSQIETQSTD